MRSKSRKYNETRFELTKEIISIENVSDETFLNTRDIRIHRDFLETLHERDWKIFESFAQRIDDSLESLTDFTTFLNKLFFFYSMDPKSLGSEYSDTDELSFYKLALISFGTFTMYTEYIGSLISVLR